MKRKKKSNLKKLQDQALNLWKEYCLKRDGGICQVRKHYPSVPISHTNVMQSDHCFSRNDKNLFLDPANSTCICSGCNMLKGFGQKGVDYMVHEIVKKREGVKKHDEMLMIHLHKNGNPGWKLIPWLEIEIDKLTRLIDRLN